MSSKFLPHFLSARGDAECESDAPRRIPSGVEGGGKESTAERAEQPVLVLLPSAGAEAGRLPAGAAAATPERELRIGRRLRAPRERPGDHPAICYHPPLSSDRRS